jgi:hypothetical protein
LKAFPQFTREYVRDGISYLNLTLLMASIPPYRGIEDEKGEKGRTGERMNGRTGKFKHANEVFEWF